jgi:hypothetical protein
MLTVTYAECRNWAHYAECRYAECHYAECRYAECRSVIQIPEVYLITSAIDFKNILHS